MNNLLTVAFEAHHPEKNHHRRYQVTLGRDLFDEWLPEETVAVLDGGRSERETRSERARRVIAGWAAARPRDSRD